jgi:hypothetical protein
MHEHRSTDELQNEIGHAREDFASTIDEIVNRRLRAKEQLQRHPVGFTLSVSGVSIAVGLLFGTLLGRMLTRRGTRQPRFFVRI